MEPDVVKLEGFIHIFSETGTEGGYWALQDKRFITPRNPNNPYGSWDYRGLHILRDGDNLTIFSKNHGGVVWSGKIKLKKCTLKNQSVKGIRIHDEQEGIDRKTWAKWFFDEWPAILIKNKPTK